MAAASSARETGRPASIFSEVACLRNSAGNSPAVQVHVHADAQDDVLDAVQFRAEFGQNARDFFSAHQNVVGPFDFGIQAGFGWNGAAQGRGGDHRQLRRFLRPQIRAAATRKTKVPCRRAKSISAPAGRGLWFAIRRTRPRLPSRRRAPVFRSRRWSRSSAQTPGCPGR